MLLQSRGELLSLLFSTSELAKLSTTHVLDATLLCRHDTKCHGVFFFFLTSNIMTRYEGNDNGIHGAVKSFR